ncbi:MAG: UDP-glucose/GDP-mannose dehydrogenase family protein [Deltaproteobacteria bacterium]|nr:UDP-glucose/GDP-mannose dehydrogenase family protein [Deltaproteobacteria bacterium]
MEICVLGTGYVGLVTGTCFSESGHFVHCVDIDTVKVKELNAGKLPFYEPGLDELVARNLNQKRLTFTTDSPSAIGQSKIIFIAVGTPQDSHGNADLKYVFQAAKTIGEYLTDATTIVIKSTVPVGTHQKVTDLIRKHSKHPFEVVSNPEFLKEGNAVEDFLKPERVVIGTQNAKTVELMKELYEPFVRSGNPIIVTDNTSAELAKYACNAFLATKISFINEMANLAEKVGANISDIRKAMTTDSRIGTKFLYPGTGYGGSCFPKDIQALMATAKHHDYPLKIVEAVETVNQEQKEILFQKAHRYFKGHLQGKCAAIWGLSFKPNTDDLRQAPSISVIRKLLDHGVKTTVYDPVAMLNASAIFEDRIQFGKTSYDCLKNADMLFVLTEWNEFRKPDFQKIKSLMKTPVILDGRNIFNPSQVVQFGFYYEGIGLK